MIQKFNQYNESLRDQMVGLSEEEMIQKLDIIKNEVKNAIDHQKKLDIICKKFSHLVSEPDVLRELLYVIPVEILDQYLFNVIDEISTWE